MRAVLERRALETLTRATSPTTSASSAARTESTVVVCGLRGHLLIEQ
jgi:hypothetical protein